MKYGKGPFITVDAIVTTKHGEIVLIKRAIEPFMDKYVLPGGHFEDSDKNLKEACARELREETGLDIDPEKFYLLGILDGKNRDPRPERRVSIVFRCELENLEDAGGCKPGSDAKSIEIRKFRELKEEEIGFDHWKMIKNL